MDHNYLYRQEGFVLVENTALGDSVMIDNAVIGDRKQIQVGNFARFCFTMWGVREDIVQVVCQHALNKLHTRIDNRVDVIRKMNLQQETGIIIY